MFCSIHFVTTLDHFSPWPLRTALMVFLTMEPHNAECVFVWRTLSPSQGLKEVVPHRWKLSCTKRAHLCATLEQGHLGKVVVSAWPPAETSVRSLTEQTAHTRTSEHLHQYPGYFCLLHTTFWLNKSITKCIILSILRHLYLFVLKQL